MSIEEIRKRKKEIEQQIDLLINEFEKGMGGYLGKDTASISKITFIRDGMGAKKLYSNIDLSI